MKHVDIAIDMLMEPRYSMRWRWGFWQAVKTHGWVDDERIVYWHPCKANVVAHLVGLKLQGHVVKL